jgi:arsenite methyltransferase
VSRRPDYGLDAPHVARNTLLIGLAGAALTAICRSVRAPRPLTVAAGAVALWGLTVAPFHVYSSRVLKPREARRLIDALRWRGDERVLDVGCGRGMLLVTAARRLANGGRAVGVDTWVARHHASTHGSATLDNAAAEGVGELVALCDGEARRLPFRDGSFDVVVSSLCVHNISWRPRERRHALEEMVRVLRPGGQLALMDIVYSAQYARTLRALGMQDVRHHWRLPLWGIAFGTVTAVKSPSPAWGGGACYTSDTR